MTKACIFSFVAILALALDAGEPSDAFFGTDFGIAKNSRGIRAVRLAKHGGGSNLTVQDPAGNWPLSAKSVECLADGSLRVVSPWPERQAEVVVDFAWENGKRKVCGKVNAAETCSFTGTEVDPNPKPQNVPPLFDGSPWPQRRAAILKTFAEAEFGVRPVERPADLAFKALPDVPMLGGKAVHRAVEISCRGPLGPFAFTAHAYLPKAEGKVGAFVSISLGGRIRKERFVPTADDPSFHSCPIRDIVGRGYAVVVFDNWDVALDDKDKCFSSGVFAAFGPKERTATSWGALSAWAWGASRVADWLATQPEIDMRRLGVVGHSRGGKTALWAGATDERFTLVCDNASGAGGSKLNHIDLPAAETLEFGTRLLPHFYSAGFRQYALRESTLGFDQHMLLALVAPRRLCVGSCAEDSWAGPAGQHAACLLASPAWAELGAGGLGDRVRWHMVPGGHDLSIANWRHYLDAMDELGRDLAGEGENETAKWQAAVDAAAARGGGTVTLTAGRHALAGLFLKSNVTLEIPTGCVVEGRWNIRDYPDIHLAYAEIREPWQAVIAAVGQTNVAVVGAGEIFGNGRRFPIGSRLGRPRGMLFYKCANVRVEGLTMRELASWTCYFNECDGVVFRKMTVDSHANHNNDGVDIDAKNVLVEDCDIDADDDGIVLKSDNPNFIVENVEVRNCEVRSCASLFKLGTASHGGFRNIRFHDCTGGKAMRECIDPKTGNGFMSDYRASIFPGATVAPCPFGGMLVECVDGALVENVSFRDMTIRDCCTPIFVRGETRLNRKWGNRVLLGIPFGTGVTLRNIVFENITARARSWTASSITGVPLVRPKNVALRNVEITMPGSGNAGQSEIGIPVPEVEDGYPDPYMFRHRMLPAYGFYVRHADDVTFENVRVNVLGGDCRPMVLRDDVTGL